MILGIEEIERRVWEEEPLLYRLETDHLQSNHHGLDWECLDPNRY